MRKLLLALLFPAMACAETVIVQTWSATELYGHAITREYVGLSAEPVTSVYLKKFRQEAYGNRVEANKEVAVRYDNEETKLVAVGKLDGTEADVSFMATKLEKHWCNLDTVLSMIHKSRFVPAFYTIMADKSEIGTKLAACYSAQLDKHKVKHTVVHMDSVLDLRKYLRSVEFKKPGLLLNALVGLKNDDTLQDYGAERIVLEIHRWNSDHLDIGPIKHKDFKYTEAITVGIRPEEIAGAIDGHPMKSSVFINRDRLDALGMRAIYISNIDKIDGITINDE